METHYLNVIALNVYFEYEQNSKINNHATLIILLPSIFFGNFVMLYEAIYIRQGYTVRRQRIITSLP